jgi:3-phosphoshikimate 1-carboxyvinyltransferase
MAMIANKGSKNLLFITVNVLIIYINLFSEKSFFTVRKLCFCGAKVKKSFLLYAKYGKKKIKKYYFCGLKVHRNMIYRVKAATTFNVAVNLPASKSISARVLILNSLSNSECRIINISECEDTTALRQGLAMKQRNENRPDSCNIGAAGTAMRFLTACFATCEGLEALLDGSERMRERPVRLLVEALCRAGADIEYVRKAGFPPLRIRGRKLVGGSICLAGSVSSQYVSALLMIAPLMRDGLQLTLTGAVVSKPYIDMTVALMQLFGAEVQSYGSQLYVKPQPYHAPNLFTVESDWSAASYWYEALSLSSDSRSTVSLRGLVRDSLQGDSAVADLFAPLGIKTVFTADGVQLSKQARTVSGIYEHDFVATPDIAQTVAVTCAMLGQPFRFTGLQSLRIKETDRLQALHDELLKCGIATHIGGDGDGGVLTWDGSCVKREATPRIDTYKDHRMAMAFTPVALALPEGIEIADPSVVNKSYPSFWEDMGQALSVYNL